MKNKFFKDIFKINLLKSWKENYYSKLKQKLFLYSKENWIKYDHILNEYLVVFSIDILSKYEESKFLLLKWWSALSLFYWSDRISTDLDIDLHLNFLANSNSVSNEMKIYTMFKKIKDKWIQNIEWMIFEFKIWDFINKSWKIKKYKWEFIFNNHILWIENRKVEIDLSFENYWAWNNLKLVDKKRELFLIEKEIKFNCMNKEEILLHKIISFWDRYKFNDLYDINFLITNFNLDIDEEWIREQSSIDYRENRDHIFYWKENLNDIKEVFIERIHNFFKRTNQEDLDITINKNVSKDSKINDYIIFFEDFLNLIQNKFEEKEFWELPSYFIDDEVSLKKYHLTNYLKWWNKFSFKENKKQPEMKLSDCLVIWINWDFYIINLNWVEIERFKLKNHLIEYLITSQLNNIDLNSIKF